MYFRVDGVCPIKDDFKILAIACRRPELSRLLLLGRFRKYEP